MARFNLINFRRRNTSVALTFTDIVLTVVYMLNYISLKIEILHVYAYEASTRNFIQFLPFATLLKDVSEQLHITLSYWLAILLCDLRNNGLKKTFKCN